MTCRKQRQTNSQKTDQDWSLHIMASVEAAASLFGSDEVFSDPFAALGTDMVSQTSGDQFFGDRTSDLEYTTDKESHTSGYSTLPGSSSIAGEQAEWYGSEAPSQSEERQEVTEEASFTTGMFISR